MLRAMTQPPGTDGAPLLSVVMPVYNEAATIDEILRRVRAVDVDKEIIVVDDGSSDGTLERLAAWEGTPGVTVLRHERNRGKGAALQTGFARVRGRITVIQDADLEYDPREYPILVAPILDGRADVVYGSRFLGGPHRVLLFWHYMGNRFLTFLSNLTCNLNLTDMETCYKVFRSDVLRDLTVTSRDFRVEPELTAKFARRRLRIYEVPISYSGRDYSEGKKIGWQDGVKALGAIVRYRLFE
jgi:glycosyltransferase involved in cell wall biosynthesis